MESNTQKQEKGGNSSPLARIKPTTRDAVVAGSTLTVVGVSAYLCFWCYRRMDIRNEREVARMAKERDDLQKMFIQEFQSSQQELRLRR